MKTGLGVLDVLLQVPRKNDLGSLEIAFGGIKPVECMFDQDRLELLEAFVTEVGPRKEGWLEYLPGCFSSSNSHGRAPSACKWVSVFGNEAMKSRVADSSISSLQDASSR